MQGRYRAELRLRPSRHASPLGSTCLEGWVQHERIIHSRGGRVREAFHIQNVNGLHSRFKNWLRRFNGVSIARLPLYGAWFVRIERELRRQTADETLKMILAA